MSDNSAVAEKEVEVLSPESILGELKWLAKQMGVTPRQALRQALATQAYIERVQQRGDEILVKRGDELLKVTFQTR